MVCMLLPCAVCRVSLDCRRANDVAVFMAGRVRFESDDDDDDVLFYSIKKKKKHFFPVEKV